MLSEQDITQLIEALVFPPGGLLMLWLLGLMLLWRRAGLGVLLMWVTCAAGFMLSTPFGAELLVRPLEDRYAALSGDAVAASNAGAIVVLSGGFYRAAPEFGGDDTVGDETLVRLRYAAYLHHLTKLPVVVSGGVLSGGEMSLATAMANILRRELGVADVWLEAHSLTTAENATFTKELLAERHVERVLLVTHALHMPRSVEVFRQVGIDVVAAPTRFHSRDPENVLWRALIPDADSLELSRAGMHEWVGRIWYRVRHGVN